MPPSRTAAPPSRRALDPADPRWERLRTLVDTHSLLRGEFVLSSGRTSNYLFQLRQTMLLPESAALLGEVTVEFMRREGVRAIGGMALGAIPFVSAVSVMSHGAGYPVQAFFVRKEAKGHGARERINGHLNDGAQVLIIDDVATTGGSALQAYHAMKEEYPGCSSRTALVIVDREEGAGENFAAAGIEMVSLFRRSDFTV